MTQMIEPIQKLEEAPLKKRGRPFGRRSNFRKGGRVSENPIMEFNGINNHNALSKEELISIAQKVNTEILSVPKDIKEAI